MTNIYSYIVYPKNQDLSKTWFVQYTNPTGGKPLKKYGNLSRLSTILEREQEVDRLVGEIQKEWNKVTNLAPAGMMQDLLNVVEFRQLGRRKKTKGTYQTFYNVFFDWFKDVKTIVPYDRLGNEFSRHLLQNGRNNTTHNNHNRNLRSFFEDLITQHGEKYKSNPFAIVRNLTESRQTKRWFKPETQQELKKLISEQDPQLWLACLTQFYCFIRPVEMAELKVENVNFETKRFEINSVTAKNSKFEVVPIPPQLLKELEFIKKYPGNYYLFGKERLPSPNRNGRDTLSYRHKKFTSQLGLKRGHTFYSWKNTGAVEMVKTGTHLKIISMLMRHSSLEITQDYLSTLGIDDLLNQIQINYPEI